MNQHSYSLKGNPSLLDFEFVSEGPKGKIKKAVRYSLQNSFGTTYLNLAFGDLKEEAGSIDDTVVSNNEDKAKVLRTVGETVRSVTGNFPDMFVFAQGSSPARTRLYQMGIAANLAEIETFLMIWGVTGKDWVPFSKGINFEAFPVKRK